MTATRAAIASCTERRHEFAFGPLRCHSAGGLLVLAVGAVHAYEYFVQPYSVIPFIGPLFVLRLSAAPQ